MIDSDESISETSEKSLTQWIPANRSALRSFAFSGSWWGFNGSNCFWACGHEIPDFDSVFSSGSYPLHFRIEGNLVDGRTSIIFSLILLEILNVPDLKFLVLSASSQKSAIGSNANAVSIAFMSFECVFALEVGAPNLQSSVPSYTCKVWLEILWFCLWFHHRWVSNTTNPISMVILFACKHALS